MVKLTQQTVSKISDAMVSHPRDQVVLYETGEVGIERGGRYFQLTGELTPRKTDEPKEVWRRDVLDLTEQVNPKLKYKTHLAKYLYQELNSKLEDSGVKLTGNKKIDDILKSTKYQNYLKNEPVNIQTYVNNKNEIRISAESTSFGNHTLKHFYSKAELMQLHEEARQLAVNDSRAKVRKPYKYKKFIAENAIEYQNAYRQYYKDFTLLSELWAWKLSGDGVRVGYSEDDIYNKIILPVEFRLQKMEYNQKIIRRVEQMVFDLKETIKKANDENIISYGVTL